MPRLTIEPRDLLASAGFSNVLDLIRMDGADAAVWQVRLPGRVVALRVLSPGRSVANEVEAQTLAIQLGAPAPRVISHGLFSAHPYTITTWLPGQTLARVLMNGGDPHKAGRLLGRAMATLHGPDHTGHVLCHGDLQPFNLLVEGDHVSGIVDWSDARQADPREDLAATRVILQLGPAIVPAFTAGTEDMIDGFSAGYAELRPLPDDENLRPFARRAADRQLKTWTARADQGSTPRAVAAAAQDVAEAWQ